MDTITSDTIVSVLKDIVVIESICSKDGSATATLVYQDSRNRYLILYVCDKYDIIDRVYVDKTNRDTAIDEAMLTLSEYKKRIDSEETSKK